MDLRLIERFHTYTHRETVIFDEIPTKLSTATKRGHKFDSAIKMIKLISPFIKITQ